MEVAHWLKTLGLDQYAPRFFDNRITGDLLPSLTADDLKDLGINSVGHRRRMLDPIALLREKASADANEERLPAEQRETAPGERPQVTVLFADLTGYTDLSKLLDAEEIEGILIAALSEGEALLSGNVVAHDHLLFRKVAIEASILLHDWDEAERHATIARARAFAAVGKGCCDAQLEGELLRLQIEGDRLGICLPDVSEAIRPTLGRSAGRSVSRPIENFR